MEPEQITSLGRDTRALQDGELLLSLPCMGDKQAEPGTSSKLRGPGTEAPPPSGEQEAPEHTLMPHPHVCSRWGTGRVTLSVSTLSRAGLSAWVSSKATYLGPTSADTMSPTARAIR